MATAKDDISIPLEPQNFYHIFNRGNNGEDIFYQQKNYVYFLKKYDLYLSDYADTYCYCLLPNHFHFLIRVKPACQIEERIKADFLNLQGLENLPASWYVSKRFRSFFSLMTKLSTNKSQEKEACFKSILGEKKCMMMPTFLLW